MGSFRFGQVAGALSEGIGLFAGHKAEEEQNRVKMQWDMALANMREQNAVAREERQYAHSEAIEETRSAERTEAARLTAEHREATLAQDRTKFDRKMAAEAKEAHRERMEYLSDEYKDKLEANMGSDPDDRLKIDYMQRRDEAIASFVFRMANSEDMEGGKGAPGFKNLNSAKAWSAKLIAYEMSPAVADSRGEEIWGQLKPASERPYPLAGSTEAGPYSGVPYAPGQPEYEAENALFPGQFPSPAIPTSGGLPGSVAVQEPPLGPTGFGSGIRTGDAPGVDRTMVDPVQAGASQNIGGDGRIQGPGDDLFGPGSIAPSPSASKIWEFLQTPTPYGQ